MKSEFAILTEFLKTLGPEISAHSCSALTEEQRTLIEKFASGSLSESEREEILPEILENEKALRQLVDAIQSQNG